VVVLLVVLVSFFETGISFKEIMKNNGIMKIEKEEMPLPFKRILSLQNPLLQGNDVIIAQNLLLRSPYVKAISQKIKFVVDGIYGNASAMATAAFQQGNFIRSPSGVFDATTAIYALQWLSCDSYKDDGRPARDYGLLYKLYLPVHTNRSQETTATLMDANNTVLFQFRARTHGVSSSTGPIIWPDTSNAIGLNQFTTNGNTPTGLMTFDLNSPEDEPLLFGPYPVNRVVLGLQGNAKFILPHIRNGILLHTGQWLGWNVSMQLPNSNGCIHAPPSAIERVWKILVSLGVQVRKNPYGILPYPYKPQGLLSVEETNCS